MSSPTSLTTEPLAGVRILDLTRLLPGGVLGALLADLGADVIKIEEPRDGDYMRWGEPRIGLESAASWIVGRGKRSVGLDLKRPEGIAAFMRFVLTADIVIEGFRPGVMDRLGVGFDAVREHNPRIVFASLTGYGSDGAMRDAAGHDINYIARAGVLGMTGTPDGRLCMPGVQVGDLGGASLLGIGILAALHHATRTGEGMQVEVAMFDAAMAWTSIHAGEMWSSGSVPDPGHMLLNGKYPCYGVYACSDGRYLSVGAVEEKFWASFCAAVGREDLIVRHMDVTARSDVAELIATRPRDEWATVLAGVDCCVEPVLDLSEALAQPLARERGMVQDAQVAGGSVATHPSLGTPVRINRAVRPIGSPPPLLGEHSRNVAAEAGFSVAEIDALIDAGVLAETRAGQS